MSAAYEVEDASKVDLPSMHYWSKVVHHEVYDRISPSRPALSAHGKNIIVTGGGTGIGKSIAMSFAEAGASSITIFGRREAQLKETVKDMYAAASNKDSTLSYKVVDLMKREEVQQAFNSVASKVGKFDILVSNAGVLPEVGPIVDSDTTKFMQGFNMNVLTALNAVQAYLPLARTDAMIISISTAVAHVAPMPGVSGYGVSKAANLKMMDFLAAENPKLHIVSLQPGIVATEMSAQGGVKASDDVSLPGAFCVWLASSEAAFLKSKFVWANWDVDELIAKSDEIQSSRLFTWSLEGVPM